MVKVEHPISFLPCSLPDVPPGFPPQPPQASSPVESSRNQNATSIENEFLHMHGRRQSPDSFAEHPPRRTSRKRSRPQFYEPPNTRPPPASPRRRGRPPKARFISLFSRKETQTINSNEVSLTPLPRPQVQMPCLVTSLQTTEEQSSSQAKETNMNKRACGICFLEDCAGTNERSTLDAHEIRDNAVDISLTDEVPKCERARNVGCNNKMSNGIDWKMLQHVANALQYVTRSRRTSVERKTEKQRSSDMDINLTRTLKAINKKHGDITRDSILESDYMKTLVLLGICKVVQDLQNKQLKDIDISSLDSYYTAVKDAENMKVNVQWLHNRLDEIKNAVSLSNEAKCMVDERNRRLEDIDKKKKELMLRQAEIERIKSEVQDIEKQLALEVALVEELNKNFTDQMSKVSHYQQKYLMDGLI